MINWKIIGAIIALVALTSWASFAVGSRVGYSYGTDHGKRAALYDTSIDATMHYLYCLSDHCESQKAVYDWVKEYVDKQIAILDEEKAE